jgi:hypothetical protein
MADPLSEMARGIFHSSYVNSRLLLASQPVSSRPRCSDAEVSISYHYIPIDSSENKFFRVLYRAD